MVVSFSLSFFLLLLLLLLLLLAVGRWLLVVGLFFPGFASPELQQQRLVALPAVRCDAWAVQFVAPGLRRDREVVKLGVGELLLGELVGDDFWVLPTCEQKIHNNFL